MKVTFLIPPVLDKTQDVDRCFGCNYSIYFLPLLPVLYSATILQQSGCAVSIIDFAAQRKTAADFKNFIANDDSAVYVFYTVFLSQNTDRLARQIIRQLRPNAQFIFFGPQPTWAQDSFLDKEDTIIVRGEPEFIIKELLQVLESKSDLNNIKGISYYKNGQIAHNSSAYHITDLDQVPIPQRTLLDHRPYFNPKLHRLPHTAVLTSRGCFGQCWYCVPNSLSYARELEYKKEYGRKPPPRLHSAGRVIEEFSDIARLGFKSVSVIDDEFLWDEPRTIEICRGIKPLHLEWSCLARADKITEEVAQAMAEAGCSYVDLGTESFDQKVLDAVRKQMRPEDTERAVRFLKKYGVAVELNILFAASPEETEETIKNTLRQLKKLKVDYVLFSIANPFPGTDFYYAAKEHGWMAYGDYVPVDPAKNAIISYPHLSKKRLEELLAYAYRSYYLNPGKILSELLKTKSFRDLRNKFSTGFKFIYRNFLKR